MQQQEQARQLMKTAHNSHHAGIVLWQCRIEQPPMQPVAAPRAAQQHHVLTPAVPSLGKELGPPVPHHVVIMITQCMDWIPNA
jgi:hypothetical protein